MSEVAPIVALEVVAVPELPAVVEIVEPVLGDKRKAEDEVEPVVEAEVVVEAPVAVVDEVDTPVVEDKVEETVEVVTTNGDAVSF